MSVREHVYHGPVAIFPKLSREALEDFMEQRPQPPLTYLYGCDGEPLKDKTIFIMRENGLIPGDNTLYVCDEDDFDSGITFINQEFVEGAQARFATTFGELLSQFGPFELGFIFTRYYT